MITKELYQLRIGDACLLLNGKLFDRKHEALIYDKLKNYYEDSDLESAIEKLINGADKINYSTLRSALDYESAIRRENEERRRSETEAEEAKEFWRRNYRDIKEGICNRKCKECIAVYCDLIAKESFEAIKNILNKNVTIEQVANELSNKFIGAGFEALSDKEPF